MGHEIAKSLLEGARTLPERAGAVQKAVSLGMPLHEIETYLDYLDANPPPDGGDAEGGKGDRHLLCDSREAGPAAGRAPTAGWSRQEAPSGYPGPFSHEMEH